MISSGFYVLQAEFPGGDLNPIGLLLEDPISNQLHVRLRRDLQTLAGEEDAEVLLALAQDLQGKATELGAAALLRSLEDSLSNAIQITDRQPVQVGNFEWSLNQLFREHVPTSVRKFETHVPVYSLRAAAGRFIENEDVSEERWEEIPATFHGKLDSNFFAAHIAGVSMEPRIPNGSLCLFRANVVGSRQGKLVLAEDRQHQAFSIKKYESKPVGDATGNWRHEVIRLISLNPHSDSWDLDVSEDKYRILAEFVAVLS
jgi:hypothetical protein